MKRLLSVDWDFFFKLPPMDNAKTIMLYDWGHSERTIFMSAGIWDMRAAAFISEGEELPGLSGEEIDFWSRFRFTDDCIAYVGESHTHALQEGIREDVVEVVNFDAHHDCGYQEDDPTKGMLFSCENWMLGYDMLGARLVQVYPNWMTKKTDPEPGCELSVRDSGDFIKELEEPFDHIYVARSGAWTPTWLDGEFAQFIERIPVPVVKQELVEREFSRKAAEGLAKEILEFRKDFLKKV